MIEIKNLVKKFNEYTLFQIDNLAFPSTGLILIKGENGCGKTTLFNMLSLIDNDYSGQILINGKDYKQESDKIKSEYRKNNISYVFQKLNFISFLSVEENQNIYYEIDQRKKQKDISISSKENNTPIYKLSQGQQEKKRLNSGLKIEKKIYLLDEVLSSLDNKSRENYIKKIIDLSKVALVLIVSHDVDVEKYADEIYEFNNHKINCIKSEKVKTKTINTQHNYKIKNSKIFFNYSLSIFFVILLNTILSSIFFFMTYTGTFANKDDSFIYLKQTFEEEGYLIFNPQNDVTSSYLLEKFDGSCFKIRDNFVPLGVIEGNGKEDTVYCTTKTFEKYSKVDKYIAQKKLIGKDHVGKGYKIEIDETLKDGIFFQKEKNSLNDELYEYSSAFYFAFYDSDDFTKDELKNKYHKIFFYSESFYKKKNTLDYKLEDDTFYVNTLDILSSQTVTKFITPYYNSKNDEYEPNLNEKFPNGVKTVALEKLEKNPMYPKVILRQRN